MKKFDIWLNNTIYYYCDRKSKQECLYLSMNEEDQDSIVQPTKEYPLGWVFCTLYRFLLRLCDHSDVSEKYGTKGEIKQRPYCFVSTKYDSRMLNRYAYQETYLKGEAVNRHEVIRKEMSLLLSNYLVKWVKDMEDDSTAFSQTEKFLNFINRFVANSGSKNHKNMQIGDLAKFCSDTGYRMISGNKILVPERKVEFLLDGALTKSGEIEEVEKNELEKFFRKKFGTRSTRISNLMFNNLTSEQQLNAVEEFSKHQKQEIDEGAAIIDVRDYQISSVGYLFVAALQEILEANYTIKKCERCGGIFVAKRKSARYCEFRHPSNKDKTCRQHMTYQKQRSREREEICSRAYKKVSAMLLQRTVTKQGDVAKDNYENFIKGSRDWREKMVALTANGQLKKHEHLQEIVLYLLWVASFYRRSRYDGKFEKFIEDNALKKGDAILLYKDAEINEDIIATYRRMKEQALIDI